MITQRLDVQNAKLREQQDELERLRAELAAAKRPKTEKADVATVKEEKEYSCPHDRPYCTCEGTYNAYEVKWR